MVRKMRMPKVKAVFAKYWQPAAFYGGVLLFFGWLLWWQLGTLTGGYSANEAATLQQSLHLRDIFHHPLNAPFTLLAHTLLYFNHDSLFFMRITSTIFGLLTLSMFYWLVRYWHGQRAAIFGSIVFGISAWFLHAARLGTPDVLLFGLLGLTACSVWFKHSGKAVPVVLCLVLAAAFLYVPGMLWFIVAGVVWQWKTIDRIFKKHLWMVTGGGLLLLGILAPLGLAIYKTPSLAKVFVGLPAKGWPDPLTTLKNIAEVPLQLIVRGPNMPEHWLGRLAILDAFTLAMVFLGAYAYLKHRNLVRAQLMGVIVLIGIVLAGLGGAVSLSILVPFVFILAAAGIGLLLDRWYTVFPRNTIAQGVGVGLVSLAVLTSCWYGYRHYFVAWPAAPETRPVFPVKQAMLSDTIKK
jgi:hypothetical protein